MNKILKYPLDCDYIMRKKKSIKRNLLERDNFIEKRIAILGGSTTFDIKDILEIFLLSEGIKPIFYESEYNKYYEDALFNKELELFNPEIIYIHTSKYAEIAKKYGGSVPYLRDKKLANDNAKSSDVILDILNRVEKKYDLFILLQPTSPLRTEKNIIEAYKMYF